MYTEIGSFNAKARLSKLLQEVKRGHRYTITLRGQPVADLVPSSSTTSHEAQRAVEAMRHIRKIQGVSAEEIMEWISEGQK